MKTATLGTAPLEATGSIRTLNEMWEATIEYHKEELYDTEAMYQVYRSMDPKLKYQDLAIVFSGVYADTYWNTTFMDYSILSKSMTQAIGLNPEQADEYSKKAFKQWRGILSRKNSSDTGVIPVTGSYTNSIDIVCNQDTPISPLRLIEEWNNPFWATPQVGKNYVYTRVQNRAFVGGILPQVQMFYTTGGFNQPPSSWNQCFTDDGGEQYGKVILMNGKSDEMSDGIRGASEAFIFSPTSADHVCVIAAVVSQFFTKNNPKAIPTSNWDSQRWITHNGAAAWHNVDPQASVLDSLKFYNQDSSTEEFVFSARCSNVPVGATICLSSDDPEATFSTGEIVITRSTQEILKEITLPGNHEGELQVMLKDPNGNMLPATAAVELTFYWKLKRGHKHYLNAIRQKGETDLLLTHQDCTLSLGSFTLTGGSK